MNLTKLASLKAALRLTIDLAEKATLRPWEVINWQGECTITAGETPQFVLAELGVIEPLPNDSNDASYIVQACNLGAPMAKALLGLIDIHSSWTFPLHPFDVVEAHNDALESILNSFPDEF